MSGLTATALLRRVFTPADTGRVTDLLRQHAEDVMEARKGRHWACVVDNSNASLSVLKTATHRHDFEDDLSANGLDCDDAPDAFVLSFPTRRPYDCDKCLALARELAKMFGGIHSQ